MKKKLLSLLLALCLVMALVPMTAFAEGTSVDNWDGSADTSWYTSAPDASAYHISTAEQLAGLAQLVNTYPGTTNFAGKTFYLDNDLDLSGHEWISIGTVLGGDYPEYSFCGVFDGQGHVISNLYSHESYIEGADESHNLLRNALFGSVYNGEVKNLGVANAEIWIDPKDDSAAGKGILVDWMGKSKITNCWTSGSIYSGTKIEKNIGGIVGVTMQGCTISGCYSTATLTGNFTNSEGYYKNPEATKEVFTEDGWLRTGDLGTLDEHNNLYIRGRSKTMILSSSGQNIFPEEIEARLNNMPFVLESLVIERNRKLVALVYADYEALDSLGLNNPENLKTIMDENLKNLNNSVAAYEKVSQIQLYPTEFEKTPKRSIKRYLYNSIAED